MINKKRGVVRIRIISAFIFSLLFILSISVFAGRNTIVTKANEFRIDFVRYDPSPMIPGKESDLWFEISNLKDTNLEDLDITFVENYPFNARDPAIHIDSLEPSETKSFKFIVRPNENTLPGGYTTSLQFYSPSLGLFNAEVVNFSVKTVPKIVTLTDVSTEPEIVNPGGIVKIGIDLTNTYNSALMDISIKLDMVNATYFAPKSTTSEANIKTLYSGDKQRVNFELSVSPNAPADVYKIPITISYTDESGTITTKSTHVGIRVNEQPVYSIYVEDLTAFEKNTAGKVVVSVSNVGPVDIKYLTMRVLESDVYDVTSKSQVYVGNLKPDDYQTAEFNIYRKKEGPLKVIVNYKDVYNNEYSKIEDLNMNFFTSNEAKKYGLVQTTSSIGTIFLILFMIIAIAVIYQWIQHKSFKKAVNYVVLGIIVGVYDVIMFFRPSSLKQRYKEVREHLKGKEE